MRSTDTNGAIVPPSQTKKSESKMRAIVEAAGELFATQGYKGTSIRDVAEAVGLLKGSLYHYISSKDDLLYTVLQQAHVEMLRQLDGWARTDWGGPVARIEAFIAQHLRATFRNLHASKVFYQEFDNLTEGRRHQILTERSAYTQALREAIQDCQNRGLVDEALDAKLASTAILNSLNHVYQWYRPGGQWTEADVSNGLTRLFTRALLAHESSMTIP